MAPPPSEKGKPSRSSQPNIFSRYGGRLPMNLVDRMISRMPMRDIEREYTKRVIEKFHHPLYSPGITEKELKEGLDEMLRNTRDPIGRETIERIKRKFGL